MWGEIKNPGEQIDEEQFPQPVMLRLSMAKIWQYFDCTVMNSKVPLPGGKSSASWTIIFTTGVISDIKQPAAILLPTFLPLKPGTDLFWAFL